MAVQSHARNMAHTDCPGSQGVKCSLNIKCLFFMLWTSSSIAITVVNNWTGHDLADVLIASMLMIQIKSQNCFSWIVSKYFSSQTFCAFPKSSLIIAFLLCSIL